MGARVCPKEASWSPFRVLPACQRGVCRQPALLRPTGHVRASDGSSRRSPIVADLHEGRAADLAALLSGLPSARHARADVAADLCARCGRGRARSRPRSPAARCRRGISIAASASTLNDPSLSDQEVATIATWVDARRAARQPRRRAAGQGLPAQHRMDLRRARSRSCAWRRASRSRRAVRISFPKSTSIRS